MSGMLPVGFGGSVAAYDIAKSVRIRSGAGISRTIGAASTSTTKATWSGWVKRGTLGTRQIFAYHGNTAGSGNMLMVEFNSDTIRALFDGTAATLLQTTAVYRDPSAHMHVLLSYDTTQGTASNRGKLWVNGVQFTAFTTANYPALNQAFNAGSGDLQLSGTFFGINLDGYVSEINFIDGQALNASSFGEFDANGVWQPKKYTGTYGTNGFYLPFNDGTTLTNLCLDRSGNGNNFTASGVSLTAGVTYDWMSDTPTNNFAVLNPLNTSTQHAYSSANLLATLSTATDPRFAKGSAFVSSGKWVAEYKPVVATSIGSCGVGDAASGTAGGGLPTPNSVIYFGNGVIYRNGVSQGTFTAYTTANTIRIELDMDALTCAFYRDGTLVTTITGLTSSAYTFGGFANNVSDSFAFNFGQQPWQGGTPSSGFKAISTKNLPAASIENPRLHFDIALATGASIKATAEAVFPSNYLEWIKDRGNANNHQLIDTVRGSSAVLQSNTTAAETTYTAPSGSSVGWVWKAGGAAVTNTSGSVNSQVSANTAAGFSVVTFTKNAASVSFGHGLGVVPHAIIVKGRGPSVSNWLVYHRNANATPQNGGMALEQTSAFVSNAGYWNNTAPTSTVATVGSFMPNENTVAYCFSEVPGFSKIGSYTGNGSADGPFVYCGFRPRWVMVKNASIAATWLIFDAARGVSNVNGQQLYPNTSDAEVTDNVNNCMDFTANGFKFRGASAVGNGSGNTIVFMAFAETPFQSSRAR